MERAHRELVKLDQQMGVSVAQFTEVGQNVLIDKGFIIMFISQIRENHSNTSEEFQTEQAKAGDIEGALKGTIQRLQKQIKEQSRTKLTYSVRRITLLLLETLYPWPCICSCVG